jgi:centrosomal protein CEP104
MQRQSWVISPYKGYVTPNIGVDFTARELKSIHIDAVVSGIHLTLHKCHLNHLNIYNQVGIVALSLLGVPAEPLLYRQPETDSYKGSLPSAILKGLIERSVQEETPLNELAFELEQDKFVVKAIGSIIRQKELAVADDDFAAAKALKTVQTVFSAVLLLKLRQAMSLI